MTTDLPTFSQSPAIETVQEKFGVAIGDVSRLWRDRLNSRLKPLGLSQSKWRALLYLSRTPAGLMHSELARMLGIEAPTATRLIKQLEAADWLTRRCAPEDARRKLIHLTVKAKSVVTQIEAEVRKLHDETLGRVTTEQAAAGLAALQAFELALRALQ
jgi:MarR family transcriptional regulator for hemolysin